MRHRLHWPIFSVFCAMLIGLACPPSAWARDNAAPATQPALVLFAGEWQTTYGPMTLVQNGTEISGDYRGSTSGTLKGSLDGRKFTFTYAETSATGEGYFELAADGKSFSGKWRAQGVANWSDWTGTRTLPARTFEGLWKTSYGRMRLQVSGDSVRGVYDANGIARITGKVEGDLLTFTYEQPDGETGQGSFKLDSAGQQFVGTWTASKKASPNNAGGGVWTGSRVVAAPKVTYLIVLEGHWEQDLAEQEYSFGQMLRSYFTRVPTVQVRHRFFGNEAEFRRWCAEIPFIAEPVVLHISSHGTKEGVTCGGKTLGADVLVDCLRGCDNLRLLHFGTCLVAGGDIPGKIHNALGNSATYPISGYVNAADWGGSAVCDFTFLDLILARGISPAQAVRQTRKMLTFATEKGQPGDAIAPAGLTVFEPPTK